VKCQIRSVAPATAENQWKQQLLDCGNRHFMVGSTVVFWLLLTSTINHWIKKFVVTTITTKQQLVIRKYRLQYRTAFFIGKTIVKVDFIISTSLPVCFVC
jgi:hypothetical protein